MEIIAQEMLDERTDHNRKKDGVKQKIADTSGELNKCRQTNILKKKEVDALQEEWIEKEAANTGLEETIARIEESCLMMRMQKEGLEETVERGKMKGERINVHKRRQKFNPLVAPSVQL